MFILIEISLKVVPKGQINKKSALVQMVAWLLTHLGLVSHICVMKNSPHFPSDAYMRHTSFYFSYRSRGRPTKQRPARMS